MEFIKDLHNTEYFELTLSQLAQNLREFFTEQELKTYLISINGVGASNVGVLRSIEEDGYLPTIRGDTISYYAYQYINNVLCDPSVSHFKIRVRNILFRAVRTNKLYINSMDNYPSVRRAASDYINLEIDFYPKELESISEAIKNTVEESEEKEMFEYGGNGDVKLNGENAGKGDMRLNGKSAGSGISEVNLKPEENASNLMDKTVEIAALPDMDLWDYKNLHGVSDYRMGMYDENKFINLRTATAIMANKGFDYNIDKQGRMILRSHDTIFNHRPAYNLESFSRSDFITIPRDEALDLKFIIDEAILLKQPDGNDYKAFGGKALSYERLIDSLNGHLNPPKDGFKFKISLSEMVDAIEQFANDTFSPPSCTGIYFSMDGETSAGTVGYDDFLNYKNGENPHSGRESTWTVKYWIDNTREKIKVYGDIRFDLNGFGYTFRKSGGFGRHGKDNRLDNIIVEIW